MPLSISDDTLTAPPDQRKNVDLTQFKAGDRLEARILQMTSSGRTVLQFSGFRAVVDMFAGGQKGDVILFEVLPDEKPASGIDQIRKPSTTLSNVSSGTHGPKGGQQYSRVVRLNVLLGVGAPRGNAKEIALLTSKPISQAPPFTLTTVTQAALPAHSFEILSTWFRQLQKKGQRPWRTEETRPSILNKPDLSKRLAQTKSTERPGMFEAERVDRPRESHTVADYTAFHLGNWPVKMKIYGLPPGNPTDKHQIAFKAIFLLNLEHTGAVRADIQMGENLINVEFFVESEDCRINFSEALPELTTTLSPLAKHCYCHVSVSPPKIHEFLQEEGGGYPENACCDIRA